jgi:hypothetical protein
MSVKARKRMTEETTNHEKYLDLRRVYPVQSTF